MNVMVSPPPLRSLLGKYLPRHAVEVGLKDGGTAIAWVAGGHPSPRTVVLYRQDAMVPTVALVDREFAEVRAWLPGWPGLAGRSPDTVVACSFQASGIPAIPLVEYAATLEGPVAAAAAAFLAEGHVRGDGLWDWLGHPVQGPSAIDFCRRHPWMAHEMVHCPGLRVALVGGYDASLARVGAAIAARPMMGGEDDDIDDDAAGRAVEVLANFRLPRVPLGTRASRLVRAVSSTPRDAWPAPIPDGRAGDADAQAGVAAFFATSLLLQSLASASGRPMRDVLGMRGRTWPEYLRALHARSGLAPVGSGDPVEAAVLMGTAVRTGIEDMVEAFAREVIAPPLVASGMEASRADWGSRDAALRLLLGRRTLPRLCEVSAAWHRRQARISGFLQDLRGEDGSSGPRLFEDLDLGAGIFATCLRTPEDLTAEGARGPDVHGAYGLAHCVAGYAESVLAGRTAILSVRRRLPGGTYERLSTVQVHYGRDPGPSVGQHFGRANSPPPFEAVEAVPRLLEATSEGARRALAAHRPAPRRHVAQVIHEAGAWEAVRDLWSFALTRPQRAMGPEEFVAAMGRD